MIRAGELTFQCDPFVICGNFGDLSTSWSTEYLSAVLRNVGSLTFKSNYSVRQCLFRFDSIVVQDVIELASVKVEQVLLCIVAHPDDVPS